jgi:hypothetical protein
MSDAVGPFQAYFPLWVIAAARAAPVVAQGRLSNHHTCNALWFVAKQFNRMRITANVFKFGTGLTSPERF